MAYSRRAYAVLIVVSFTTFLFLTYIFSPFESLESIRHGPSVVTGATAQSQGSKQHAPENSSHTTIPNFVHYIWFIEDRDVLQFSFKHFVSIYSAHLYFQPDAIYIHTDATPQKVNEALLSGDKWTRAIFSLPNIKTNQVEMPLKTKTGKPIELVEHRSDFTRSEVLYSLGGVYMDLDVIPIRDIKPLRLSGFANVVGQELNGGINTGMTMHKPKSALMSIFRESQHEVFNGEWTTHSTRLLTELSNRLVPVPGEVLILQQKSFAPSSWTHDDTRDLFMPHTETAPPSEGSSDAASWPVPTTEVEAMAWWKQRSSDKAGWSEGGEVKKEDWEIDYSSSYVIHAFDDAVVEEWDGRITLEYVMARQSNYARAVYPAIWHAIKDGVIDV